MNKVCFLPFSHLLKFHIGYTIGHTISTIVFVIEPLNLDFFHRFLKYGLTDYNQAKFRICKKDRNIYMLHTIEV